jgi:serine/threonine-protein phosphatase 5
LCFAKKNRPFLNSLSSLDHDYVAASRLYTEAIALNPLESTLWCNRAFARMKLEEYGYALSDASEYLFHLSA